MKTFLSEFFSLLISVACCILIIYPIEIIPENFLINKNSYSNGTDNLYQISNILIFVLFLTIHSVPMKVLYSHVNK